MHVTLPDGTRLELSDGATGADAAAAIGAGLARAALAVKVEGEVRDLARPLPDGAALEVITSDEKVAAILFNIFGGITRCDEVAKGIIEASHEIELKVPLVVRLDGTNSEEGLALLAEAAVPNLTQEKTMLGAAEKVVELAS